MLAEKVDLSELNLKDLHDLQGRLKQEVKKREHENLAKAREQILAIAQNAGVPLKELIGSHMRKGSTVAVSFRHPEDVSLQWTGRGRQPKWVVEWVSSGRSLDALRV